LADAKIVDLLSAVVDEVDMDDEVRPLASNALRELTREARFSVLTGGKSE